ncbi:hypothetical protein N7488_011273 [Penicillium malachiteum]|nr:hypothetical protein N7488_011273 [Penicillium malachiteum]
MELRFLIMGGDTDTGVGHEEDLMTILMNLKAVPILRGAHKKLSYLSECFGDGLPQEENDEDLKKERCRDKFDTLSFYLSRVRTFQRWGLETSSRRDSEPLLVELREAKIEALRADLARIQAECELAFPGQRISTLNDENIGSGIFHILTVKSLCLCATIMLHRAIGLTAQTDLESQSTAQDLISLARILRKSKCLETPCSVIWPLPIFIAGIEISDEIYQDWIVDYMRTLGHWGQPAVRAKELMEQIIQRKHQHRRWTDIQDIDRGS